MRPDPDQISPEMRRALEATPARADRLRSLWSALGAVRPRGEVVPSTAEAWESLAARIGSGARPQTDEWQPRAADRAARPGSRRRRTFVAAGVVAALIAAVLLWRQPVRVAVAAGEQELVQLPDGSTVELNSASEIQYPRGFAWLPLMDESTRTVRLRGEAFFSVVSDPERPFVVRTDDARVEVLGTRFNVRSRETALGLRTLVTLQEGRVVVRAEGRDAEPVLIDSVGASVLLRVGEAPERVSNQPSLDHLLAWRTRGFAAVDEPVGEILREVQRRYSVHLELQDGLATDSAMTVFYLRGTSAEQIIHDLCLSRGWQYRETSNGFAVFPAAARSGSSDATFDE